MHTHSLYYSVHYLDVTYENYCSLSTSLTNNDLDLKSDQLTQRAQPLVVAVNSLISVLVM